MVKMKKITALLLAMTLIFSMTACGKKKTETKKTEEETTTEAVTEPESEQEPSNVSEATEIYLNFHYLRSDDNYDGWNVWLWIDEGSAYYFDDEIDEHGAVTHATFPAGTQQIGFIVRLNEWDQKDIDADQFIDTTAILAGTIDVYVTAGTEGYEIEYGEDCVVGTGVSTVELLEDYSTVVVTLSADHTDDMTFALKDSQGNEFDFQNIEADGKTVTLTLGEEVDAMGSYVLVVNGSYEYAVTTPDLYNTTAFVENYSYDGDDLGATWSKKSTTFKVWAPTATAVVLNTYESGTKGTDDLIEKYDMTLGDSGVWEVTVDGDLNGTYYTYTATNSGTDKEVCDPYAKAVGVNGDRAMVIDLDSTDPDGWDKDTNPNSDLEITDCSIYEVHVRDISSDESSGITNVGKYLGVCETGTTTSDGISTGLDHIKELGVTHVQLNPVYDYATVDETKLDTDQYNWGYDPKNYNVPEGSYSSDPYNGEVRIEEFKEMVKTLHDNGLSVVMDVVYNHTYSTDFCFNGLVPDYFHRVGSNGSGCGNDVATERAMVRKYIVDSVVYWASEYHINGFRFDLVGLMDVETMNEIRAALDEIDPSIVLYGEGWSLTTSPTIAGTELATQTNVKDIDGFAMFNDTIRDDLKGSVFNSTEKGYVNGKTALASTVLKCIKGIAGWSNIPSQLINYASCHDNMTLWDEINSSNADDSLEDRIKQNLLSAAIVYTSQGVPFILAGEEMLRTKTNADGTFNSNSYNASDEVNSIKWSDLSDENYQTVFEYYKGLIALRKAHAAFRSMDKAIDYYTALTDTDDGVIAYELAPNNGEVSDGIFVIHNASSDTTEVTLPEGDWTIVVEGTRAGNTSLGTASGSVTVEAISTMILIKGSLK